MYRPHLDAIDGLFELHNRLRTRLDKRLKSEAGITYSQYVLLQCIQANQPWCTRAKLATASGFVSASLTDGMKRLVRDGLVIETSEGWDKRRLWIRVSDAGLEAIRSAYDVWDETLIQILDAPAPDDVRGFLRSLEEMMKTMDDRADGSMA